VYGPQPRPQLWFDGPPLWLYWLNLWWEVLRCFLAGMPQNSFPNTLVVRSYQNQCCALAWGSCASFHCSEVLGPRLALKLSSAAQPCGNVESRTG
jgi:hypothetical protein